MVRYETETVDVSVAGEQDVCQKQEAPVSPEGGKSEAPAAQDLFVEASSSKVSLP